jgi:hypothetical protein
MVLDRLIPHQLAAGQFIPDWFASPHLGRIFAAVSATFLPKISAIQIG